MNLLIMGATGFLGYHLITHLLESTLPINRIVALHRKKHFFDSLCSKHKQLQSIDTFDLHSVNSNDLKQIFETYQIDCLIHLAFIMDFYPKNTDSKVQMKQVNIQGTETILQSWSLHIQHQRQHFHSEKKFLFLFASSQEAMGPSNTLSESITEESTTCHPTFLYGEQKLAIEMMITHYAKQYQFSHYNLRFVGIIGPNSDYAVNEMIRLASYGIFSMVYPGYECHRGKINVIHVKDCCNALEAILKKQEVWTMETKPLQNTLLIGSPQSMTYANMIDVTCQALHWNRPLFTMPLTLFTPFFVILSIFLYQFILKPVLQNKQSFMLQVKTLHCMAENRDYNCNKAITLLQPYFKPLSMEQAIQKHVSELLTTKTLHDAKYYLTRYAVAIALLVLSLLIFCRCM